MDEIMDYAKCILRFNNPRFQDVTPLFNDSVPFLVSGEMLMMTALMDDNYNSQLGGQSLHFIYVCERLLNVFKKNNGAFEIVFFYVWENIIDNMQLLLYRAILKKHFEKNTEISVHCFRSVYDPRFLALIDSLRPGFFLYNLDAKNQKGFFKNRECDFLALFCAEFVSCLKWDLPVVDLTNITVDVSLVRSYLLENDIDYKILPDFHVDVGKIEKNEKIKCITTVYKCTEIREFITCNAVYNFLKKHPQRTNDARLFVLYFVTMESLKLENRGSPIVNVVNGGDLSENIRMWQEIIYLLLNNAENNMTNWKNVCDLWQGTLLAVVYSSIDKNINQDGLGEFSALYEKYIEKINSVLKEKIAPYPIEPYINEKQFCKFKMPYCRKDDNQVPLEIVSSPIVKRFCDNLSDHVTWKNPSSVLDRTDLFEEVRHWHSRKLISDDYSHVKHDEFDRRNATAWEISRHDRQKNFQARWMNIYGTNLIGKSQEYDAIICEQDAKPVKKAKESAKAKQLKAQNIKEKEEKARKNEQEKFSELKREYKVAPGDVDGLLKMMRKVELFAEKSECAEIRLEILVLKARIHDKICAKLKKLNGIPESDIEKLFLTIQEILKLHHSGCSLNEKQQKQLSKTLHKLGFADIALQNGLPPAKVDSGDAYTDSGEGAIRFQLRRLGAQLERETTGKYDADVGFTPDPWQCKFIDAIRNNKSALVVAPTSSGKTFASYYCMKRVLQKSKDGVVVYVSPTKALVNQVSATISVKFRNAPSQPGVSTVGVFTRDYRVNGLNSRILVTVPQCLEILLMSPRRYSWAKKIKYVIFDEIHCLKGSYSDTAGITWERCILMIRCPFLALSATVRNPGDFHGWLCDLEKFKEREDARNGFQRSYSSDVVKVIYSERHSDLVKYTYLEGKGLQHCHPYSFLSHDVLNLYRDIPDNTSLSAAEVLQLYDVLKTNAPEVFTPENELAAFFAVHSKNGFVTHGDVKAYEAILRQLFYDIYTCNTECYQRILGDLQPKHSITRDDVGFEYSRKNMIDLLSILHEKNMLPALVFCYHRGYIQVFNAETAEYFDSLVGTLDRRDTKKLEKQEKKEKKELHKLEAKAGESSNSYKDAQTSAAFNLLMPSPSFLKGVGVADHDDVEYIEKRLARKTGHHSADLMKAMQHGFAFHHAGLNNTYRSTIEMLFRIGLLKTVFATGTLAMGIHMPCKSVVVCCDSPFLSSLEYHQMAGRAGRRGFDNEGNVIFMGLNKRRQKTLLTSRLPVIDGNFPLTITFIMRMLLLITTVTEADVQTPECVTRTLSSATTLLENCLAYRKFPMLRDQMKHFFCFGTQLLYLQQLIAQDGSPLKLCSIITHLHYHEPANFAFVYILRTGAIRRMIDRWGNDRVKIQWNLILIMNFLFARLPLHKTQLEKTYNNSCVILEPIPKIIVNALKRYNDQVKFVFDEYFASMHKYCTKKYGPDNKLPLSEIRFENGVAPEKNCGDSVSNKIRSHCQTRSICSTFCSLSSNGDDNLYSEQNLINNVRDEVCPEVKIVPIIDVDLKINSYAADFYRHGIVQAIIHDNGLKHGQEYQLLNDFRLVLKTVVLALEELEPVNENDLVLYHFQAILEKYQENFFKAFSN